MNSSRKAALLSSGFALVALVVLASTLGNMEFAGGQPFTLTWNQVTQGRWPNLLPTHDASLLTVLRAMMLIYLWILVPLALVYSLMSPEGRRKLIRIAGASTVLPLLIFALSKTELLANLEIQTEALSELPDENLLLPTAIGTSQPPSWLTFLLMMMVLVALAALGWLAWRRWWAKPTAPLEEIADEAREAIKSIDQGTQLSDIVIRCYGRMMDILQSERDLAKDRDSTPREFQKTLLRHGLPSESVRILTHLFESARYGGLQSTEQERASAVSSLEFIAAAVKDPA